MSLFLIVPLVLLIIFMLNGKNLFTKQPLHTAIKWFGWIVIIAALIVVVVFTVSPYFVSSFTVHHSTPPTH